MQRRIADALQLYPQQDTSEICIGEVRGHIPHPLPGDLFSVGKYNESGRDFHGTIAILRLQLPHAKSLALLPNCFDSPALVKLNEAETAVTIMAYPGFFLKKTLLRRDLPATPEAEGRDGRRIGGFSIYSPYSFRNSFFFILSSFFFRVSTRAGNAPGFFL